MDTFLVDREYHCDEEVMMSILALKLVDVVAREQRRNAVNARSPPLYANHHQAQKLLIVTLWVLGTSMRGELKVGEARLWRSRALHF